MLGFFWGFRTRRAFLLKQCSNIIGDEIIQWNLYMIFDTRCTEWIKIKYKVEWDIRHRVILNWAWTHNLISRWMIKYPHRLICTYSNLIYRLPQQEDHCPESEIYHSSLTFSQMHISLLSTPSKASLLLLVCLILVLKGSSQFTPETNKPVRNQ